MSLLGILKAEVAEGDKGAWSKDAKENSSTYCPWGFKLGRFKNNQARRT